MIPYPEVLMEPNRSHFLALGAIVGMGKIKGPEKWPEWARLVEKYNWRIVLKAADRVEPEKRWSANIESVCIQIAKDDAEAKAFAEKPEPITTPLTQSQRSQRSLTFQTIMAKHGLLSPTNNERG